MSKINNSDLNDIFLSHEAYNNFKVGNTITTPTTKFKVIKVSKPNKNGFSSIAVAPIDKRENIDYSNVTVAFRGTEGIFDTADRNTDIQNILRGTRGYNVEDGKSSKGYSTINDQFTAGLNFVKSIQNDPKLKGTHIELTGHSLGAALAYFVGAELQLGAKGFSGPNIYKLLSDAAKKRVDNGETQEYLKNYFHDTDMIGTFTEGSPEVSEQIKAMLGPSSFGGTPVNGHDLESFVGTDAKGNLLISIVPEVVALEINRLTSLAEESNKMYRYLINALEAESTEVRKIQTNFYPKVGSGNEYDHLSESFIDRWFDEHSTKTYRKQHFFIDVDAIESVARKVKKMGESYTTMANFLATVSNKLTDTDLEWAQNFRETKFNKK